MFEYEKFSRHDDKGWRGIAAFIWYVSVALLLALSLIAIIAHFTGTTDAFINSFA